MRRWRCRRVGVPAYAGMTWVGAGMTSVSAGMTWVGAGMT